MNAHMMNQEASSFEYYHKTAPSQPNSNTQDSNRLSRDDEPNSNEITMDDPTHPLFKQFQKIFIPYATSIAKLLSSITKQNNLRFTLNTHKSNGTFPPEITIKNKFIESMTPEAQNSIYMSILNEQITAIDQKISDLNTKIHGVKTECYDYFQNLPELYSVSISAATIAKCLCIEIDKLLLEYNQKQHNYKKTKAVKEIKFNETKAKLNEETTINVGEKAKMTKTIASLSKQIKTLQIGLKAKRPVKKGASRSLSTQKKLKPKPKVKQTSKPKGQKFKTKNANGSRN
jgi:hypothetical protein